MFGSKGLGQGQFKRPNDVAVDNEGFVYVADQINHRMPIKGQFVCSFGTKGSQLGQLYFQYRPAGVTVDIMIWCMLVMRMTAYQFICQMVNINVAF